VIADRHYARLLSQTNDSDSGGNVAICVDAQPLQSGAYGARGCMRMRKGGGLDIPMISGHNHLMTVDGQLPKFSADLLTASIHAGLG
jgi:hypothetical protein